MTVHRAGEASAQRGQPGRVDPQTETDGREHRGDDPEEGSGPAVRAHVAPASPAPASR